MKTIKIMGVLAVGVSLLFANFVLPLHAQSVIEITSANIDQLLMEGLKDGNYALAEDITLPSDEFLKVADDASEVHLDLRSFTLMGDYRYVILVDGNHTLIVDGSSDARIESTHPNYTNTTESAIRVRNNANLMIHNGSFVSEQDGITMNNGGRLMIYNGNFNTDAIGQWGVYVDGAQEVIINGGIFGGFEDEKDGLELIDVQNATIYDGQFLGGYTGVRMENTKFQIHGGIYQGHRTGLYLKKVLLGSTISNGSFTGVIDPMNKSFGAMGLMIDDAPNMDFSVYMKNLSTLFGEDVYPTSKAYIVTKINDTRDAEYFNATSIRVEKDAIASIALKTMPTKMNYKVNETFDPKGLVITLHYLSGKEMDVAFDSTAFTFDKSILNIEDNTMTLSYLGMHLTFPIHVVKADTTKPTEPPKTTPPNEKPTPTKPIEKKDTNLTLQQTNAVNTGDETRSMNHFGWFLVGGVGIVFWMKRVRAK